MILRLSENREQCSKQIITKKYIVSLLYHDVSILESSLWRIKTPGAITDLLPDHNDYSNPMRDSNSWGNVIAWQGGFGCNHSLLAFRRLSAVFLDQGGRGGGAGFGRVNETNLSNKSRTDM